MQENAARLAAEQRRHVEKRTKDRAEKDARMRAYWEEKAEAGRRIQAEQDAKLSPEEHEAQRLRQQQGPRMRM